MKSVRRAVIDVGTNSIKLLVADVRGHDVSPVLESSRQTRLGQGFYDTHRLQPRPIAETARAVADFAAQALALGSAPPRVIATSAARDALNASDLVSAIHRASNLDVEVISGEQEADWAFRGATTHPALAKIPLLLFEAGGGSSQFILGQGEEKHFRHSYKLGTVRLLEKSPHSDPPTPDELARCREIATTFLRRYVKPDLAPALCREIKRHPRHSPVTLVGTGGTATILARIEAGINTYDRAVIEATRLSLDRLREHLHQLWTAPLNQRRKTVGLPSDRADVILTGAVIYEAVMAEFEFSELRISTRGLRFAAVLP